MIFGGVLILLGAFIAIHAIAVPLEKFEAFSWKGKLIEQGFGKKAAKGFYFVIGILFVIVGYQILSGTF